MNGISSAAQVPPANLPASSGSTRRELKRGMLFNTIALLASNFRGVFTFLVARILGAAILGTFLVAWATMDILSKIGMFGLDNATIAFISHAEVAGERSRSRVLFRLAVSLAVIQSTLVALAGIAVVRLAGRGFGLNPRLIEIIPVMLCALPGVTLYRICTAVSRSMKVMKHDIWSRGVTESSLTTLAFLATLALGWRNFGPVIAAIVGTGASGLVALFLAASLFRTAPSARGAISYRAEGRRLLSYSAAISGYDLINSFIVRLDVIMLGFFVGHAPGVTLHTVGIYGMVVEIANGLRKVDQAFTPIFAPLVARMTVHGEQTAAAAAFARVAQWMLWVLLPLLIVLALAGSLILSIYGPAFREGAIWLDIVALACGTNCFVDLAETVIMVQQPRLNLINSAITCIVALAANVWLIKSLGVIGAAFGILLPYLLLGVLRHRTLRLVFGWERPWRNVAPPVIAAAIAVLPAVVCRLLLSGVVAEITSALVFLLCFGSQWWFHFHPRRSGSR